MSEAIDRHVLLLSAVITGLIFGLLLLSGMRYLNFAAGDDFLGREGRIGCRNAAQGRA
jgi:hypothetical protein